MLELTIYENLAADQRESAAKELHERIVGDANRVVFALCDLAEHLKIMRDCRLYADLGMNSFEEYVEQKVGLKQRQAYNYISAYERLGPKVLRENGNLGITKLNLLAEVSAVDRADFLEENDLDGMTVQEVRELVRKTKDQGEQLDMLQNALTEAQNRQDGLQKLADSRKMEADNLRRDLEELEKRPVEVVVPEITEADREKIRKELRAEFEDQQEKDRKKLEKAERHAEKLKKELEQTKSYAEELAEKKAAERIAEIQDQAEREKQEIIEQVRKESAQMQASADAEIREANIFFTSWQEAHGKLMDKLREIAVRDPEKAGKLAGIASSIAEKMAGEAL
ncbi:MAG: DUF3102 domain-containing protein [Candidatus Merdivicinus sp.]|jgi:hypothetical protein